MDHVTWLNMADTTIITDDAMDDPPSTEFTPPSRVTLTVRCSCCSMVGVSLEKAVVLAPLEMVMV